MSVLAIAVSGCFHSNLAHSGECYNRCVENHLECNEATGYCERIPCPDGCPRGTTCDELADECVPAGW